MCFRPSPVQRDCDDNNHICYPTCGMPVDKDMANRLYSGDPVPPDLPDEFSKSDPSYGSRVI